MPNKATKLYMDQQGFFLGALVPDDAPEGATEVATAPDDQRQRWDFAAGQWAALPVEKDETQGKAIKVCVDADGRFIGLHAGDLPAGASVAETSPDDPRQRYDLDAKKWLPLDLEIRNDAVRAARAAAYISEADPIGLEYLRTPPGAEKDALYSKWLDKIAEIKTRHPKFDE